MIQSPGPLSEPGEGTLERGEVEDVGGESLGVAAGLADLERRGLDLRDRPGQDANSGARLGQSNREA